MIEHVTILVQEVFDLLKRIKEMYPDQFEYLVQCRLTQKSDQIPGGTDVVLTEAWETFNVHTMDLFKQRLDLHIGAYLEALRFATYSKDKCVRVVCVRDEKPAKYDQMLFNEENWIKSGTMYTCHEVYIDKDNSETILKIRNLEGQDIIPPAPMRGFGSWRFVIADYTKLN